MVMCHMIKGGKEKVLGKMAVVDLSGDEYKLLSAWK